MAPRSFVAAPALVAVVLIASCGSSDGTGAAPIDDAGDGGVQGIDTLHGETPVPPGDAPAGDTPPIGDALPPPPPRSTCAHPFEAAPTAGAKVVGTGSAASCTEAALSAAIAGGGAVTFACGGPATITLSKALEPTLFEDLVIDGGGVITLDGGGTDRIVHYDSGDFRKNKNVLTLQHLTLTHGKAVGTKTFAPAPAPCSQGFEDGGGGAVYVRDAALHVVDVTFVDNHAATPGPDVAGGAIYAVGTLDVTVVGSRFVRNDGSNGGAIGSLFSNLTIVDSVFDRNAANGTGANSIDASCPDVDGQREAGSGGNGGAVVIDGGEAFTVTFCGDVFTANKAGALGGASFRTPDLARQSFVVDQCTFDGNLAKNGGAAYFHHSDVTVTATTFSNNVAEGSGGIQADDTRLDLTNVTMTGNAATKGLGGAVALFGGTGTWTSCTFAENHADGGSGLFGAAIAGNPTLVVHDTLFWNDTSKDGGAPMTCQASNSGDHDLQWPKNHDVGGAPDAECVPGITFADAQLDALADNGGVTRTMAPRAGSPAIGAGSGCPKTDQRGHPRPSDKCTIGAVEAP